MLSLFDNLMIMQIAEISQHFKDNYDWIYKNRPYGHIII